MEQTTAGDSEAAKLAKGLTNPGMSLLAKAYVGAWGELDNVVKNADNPHFGSTYADLGAVMDTVKPVFAKHGLALLITPGMMEGDKLSASWMLIHESGQHVLGTAQIPVGKATAQAVGSVITYIRRYLTAAIAGIAQVDDDGNAASESAPRGTKAPKAKGSVAIDSSDLLAQIEGCSTVEALEALRPVLKEIGSQELADAYAAKKRELKNKGGK